MSYNKPKQIFNQSSNERFEDAKVINGNPNGIINFNQSPHQWATSLYKKMIARTWFPEQVNVAKDKVNYSCLTNEEKRMYDLVLAQLITNDSIQTNQLADKVNSYITSPVINSCIVRQSWEEVNHSFSYAVMAEDIAQDTERIYNLYHYDEELRIKNQSVEDMYKFVSNNTLSEHEDNITLSKPTDKDLLMIFIANQILEELVFPGGFVSLLSLDNKMPGTTEMIVEILKD